MEENEVVPCPFCHKPRPAKMSLPCPSCGFVERMGEYGPPNQFSERLVVPVSIVFIVLSVVIVIVFNPALLQWIISLF